MLHRGAYDPSPLRDDNSHKVAPNEFNHDGSVAHLSVAVIQHPESRPKFFVGDRKAHGKIIAPTYDTLL